MKRAKLPVAAAVKHRPNFVLDAPAATEDQAYSGFGTKANISTPGLSVWMSRA